MCIRTFGVEYSREQENGSDYIRGFIFGAQLSSSRQTVWLILFTATRISRFPIADSVIGPLILPTAVAKWHITFHPLCLSPLLVGCKGISSVSAPSHLTIRRLLSYQSITMAELWFLKGTKA